MIEGIHPSGPEAASLRVHLRGKIEAASQELEIPGQPVAVYDVLRGKLIAWRHLLRDLDHVEVPPTPPGGKRGPY